VAQSNPRKVRVFTAICEICGKEFQVQVRRGGVPKTCSAECKRKRTNKMSAAYRANRHCPPDKHGTLTGYSTYGCPCADCRRAAREYKRKQRANEPK
jgi:hypothetical protein